MHKYSRQTDHLITSPLLLFDSSLLENPLQGLQPTPLSVTSDTDTNSPSFSAYGRDVFPWLHTHIS